MESASVTENAALSNNQAHLIFSIQPQFFLVWFFFPSLFSYLVHVPSEIFNFFYSYASKFMPFFMKLLGHPKAKISIWTSLYVLSKVYLQREIKLSQVWLMEQKLEWSKIESLCE